MQALGKGSIAWWLKLLLDVLWFALLALFAVITLATIYRAASGDYTKLEVNLGVRFELEPERYKISSEQVGVERAEIRKAQGELHFTNPRGVYAFAFMAWSYLALGIALVVVHQLRGLFRTLAARAPFDRSNAGRIRTIALALLAGQALGALMRVGFGNLLKQQFAAEGLTLAPAWGLNFAAILVALVLLVIAEVFRVGAEMKEEQDLTV